MNSGEWIQYFLLAWVTTMCVSVALAQLELGPRRVKREKRGGTVPASGNGQGNGYSLRSGDTGSRRTLASRIAAPFWCVTDLLFGYELKAVGPGGHRKAPARQQVDPPKRGPVTQGEADRLYREHLALTRRMLSNTPADEPGTAITAIPMSHPAMQAMLEQQRYTGLADEAERQRRMGTLGSTLGGFRLW